MIISINQMSPCTLGQLRRNESLATSKLISNFVMIVIGFAVSTVSRCRVRRRPQLCSQAVEMARRRRAHCCSSSPHYTGLRWRLPHLCNNLTGAISQKLGALFSKLQVSLQSSSKIAAVDKRLLKSGKKGVSDPASWRKQHYY